MATFLETPGGRFNSIINWLLDFRSFRQGGIFSRMPWHNGTKLHPSPRNKGKDAAPRATCRPRAKGRRPLGGMWPSERHLFPFSSVRGAILSHSSLYFPLPPKYLNSPLSSPPLLLQETFGSAVGKIIMRQTEWGGKHDCDRPCARSAARGRLLACKCPTRTRRAGGWLLHGSFSSEHRLPPQHGPFPVMKYAAR